VAAANPLATDAGFQVLKAGGSAVDAAIAVQMVLTLVEPQSSGIGGGAFLLHWPTVRGRGLRRPRDRARGRRRKLFLGADGKPLPFYDGVVGGRSVGVPGTVRMLEMAHRSTASCPGPAVQAGHHAGRRRLQGQRAAQHPAGEPRRPSQRPGGRRLFLRRRRQTLARGPCAEEPGAGAVLRGHRRRGSKALHEGEVAQAIVDKVRKHPTNPGRLSLADLAGYQPRKREALCHDYAVAAQGLPLCGFPPPSSGAIAIGQILGILANTRRRRLPLQDGLPSADWLHLYTEAARLAFADRAQYVADPTSCSPPAGSWMSLLEPAYLASAPADRRAA
jgi:gamma-glutamyltranspeptidase/glutathione hydrolase